MFLLKDGHTKLRLRECISRWIRFCMEAKGGPRLTSPPGGWPEQAAGSPADLQAIVCWILTKQQQAGITDIAPTGWTASRHLQAHIEGIVYTLLSELRQHSTSPTLKDELERVRQSLEHARKLRDNLLSLSSPGVLHQTLHKLGAGRPSDPTALPSASKSAKALIWTDWAQDRHPLDALIVALNAYGDHLNALPKRGHNNLLERTKGDPRKQLGKICARLLSARAGVDAIQISESGLVFKLMLQLWTYTTGLDETGANLGYFAKKAAANERARLGRNSS
ncbi:MAG: hypothetical protein ACRYHQ_30460 [Janthinobacterium lividum]